MWVNDVHQHEVFLGPACRTTHIDYLQPGQRPTFDMLSLVPGIRAMFGPLLQTFRVFQVRSYPGVIMRVCGFV